MSPAQCRAARSLLNWRQSALADAASLGLSTVVDFERERRDVSENAKAAIVAALEAADIEFVSNERGEGVVRLRKAR